MLELGLTEEQASSYYLASLILFTASRFISTWLMRYMSPSRLLALLSTLAIICTFIVAFGSNYAGVYALVGISGCMSLMFPTIFGLSVRGLGDDTKLGGSGLIMAILGGAVLTALQGQISDLSGSIKISYFIPMICFLVVLYFSLFVSRKDLPESVIIETV
jgi:FHS family L-fucose permease-like MFS transporter